MPAVIFWAIGAAGAALAARWLIKENHRVNADLDRIRAGTAQGSADRPVLKRDPATGIYRPS
jgi:hypothetical protein